VIPLYNSVVVVMMTGTGPPFFAPDTPFGSVFSGGYRPVETATHSSPAAGAAQVRISRGGPATLIVPYKRILS